MKAYAQEWKVCDVDCRIVEDAKTELVIADLRVPPHEGCDEAARLIAAAPDMARALRRLLDAFPPCGSEEEANACDEARAALKKAGIL